MHREARVVCGCSLFALLPVHADAADVGQEKRRRGLPWTFEPLYQELVLVTSVAAAISSWCAIHRSSASASASASSYRRGRSGRRQTNARVVATTEQPKVPASASAVAEYKEILKRVLDNRPSGTRQGLASALGKNRSFISQIANPSYSIPIPAQHLDTLFHVCHFCVEERRTFLKVYHRAHPNRRQRLSEAPAYAER